MFTPMIILRICQADKIPEGKKTKVIDMNDRFKKPDEKPKPKQELPKGDGAKCALLYSLLVKSMMTQGAPEEVAEFMATQVVEDILNDTQMMRKESQLRYNIYSTVYNN